MVGNIFVLISNVIWLLVIFFVWINRLNLVILV